MRCILTVTGFVCCTEIVSIDTVHIIIQYLEVFHNMLGGLPRLPEKAMMVVTGGSSGCMKDARKCL